jgi:hypothetical protein
MVLELGQAQFEEDLFVVDATRDVSAYAPQIEPSAVINAVVLHPHANDAFIERMRGLCAAKNLPAPQAP